MLQQDTRGVAAGSQRDAVERFLQEALVQALDAECAAQLSRCFSQVRAQRAQGERDLVSPDDYPRRRQAASTAAADPSVLEPAIVVASDSFKGSATSEQAGRWIATIALFRFRTPWAIP